MIDFRRIPNWTDASKGSARKSYFEDFMEALQSQTQLRMTNLPMRLWICETKESKVQVFH
jgi:hypothetical protein